MALKIIKAALVVYFLFWTVFVVFGCITPETAGFLNVKHTDLSDEELVDYYERLINQIDFKLADFAAGWGYGKLDGTDTRLEIKKLQAKKIEVLREIRKRGLLTSTSIASTKR